MLDFNCPVKASARSIFFSRWWDKHTEPAKVYLCFPGAEGLCIKLAFDMGIITKDTLIIGVECDNRVWRNFTQEGLSQYLYRKFNNFERINVDTRKEPYRFCCQLQSLLDYDGYRHKRLKNSWRYSKIGIAWFDFCGELSENNLEAIDHAISLMNKDSLLGVTLTSHTREPRILRLNKEAGNKKECGAIIRRMKKPHGKWTHSATTDDTIGGSIMRLQKTTKRKFQTIIPYRSPGKRTNMFTAVSS